MSLIGQAKAEIREEMKALIPILVRQEVKKELDRLGVALKSDFVTAAGGQVEIADKPAAKKTAAPAKKAEGKPADDVDF